MVREYLEEHLRRASEELKRAAEEYQKQKQLESILIEKIQKIKKEGDNNFTAFFPRSAQKDLAFQMDRLCEEKNMVTDKIVHLKTKKEELEKETELFKEMLDEVCQLEQKAMFHVKH